MATRRLAVVKRKAPATVINAYERPLVT